MHQPPDQGAQIEAAIDAVLGFGEVTTAVLIDIELMIRPAQGRFAVGDEGIDPAEWIQLAGLAGATMIGP